MMKLFPLCRLRYNFTSNVEIIHVSLWDLCSNLSNEIKNELDVISFALLYIHIPDGIEFINQLHLQEIISYQLGFSP